MNKTWGEILQALLTLSPDQLQMTASVYDAQTGEVMPVADAYTAGEMRDTLGEQHDVTDVVGEDQPLIIIGFQP